MRTLVNGNSRAGAMSGRTSTAVSMKQPAEEANKCECLYEVTRRRYGRPVWFPACIAASVVCVLLGGSVPANAAGDAVVVHAKGVSPILALRGTVLYRVGGLRTNAPYTFLIDMHDSAGRDHACRSQAHPYRFGA